LTWARLAALGVHADLWPTRDLDTRVIRMTPQVAEQFLAIAEPWRTGRARPELVAHYAQLMATGRWPYTGDTAKVNAEGRFMDATHRCLATLEASWTGPMAVALGVPPEAAYAMNPAGLGWNGEVA
jgi:hypothetical protein